MCTVKLYLVETPGNGREFSLSPVNTTGAYIGGPRMFELPDGFEAVIEKGYDPVILDQRYRSYRITTIPLQSGTIVPLLEGHGFMTQLKPAQAGW
jgi:hypothetical protein